MWTELQLQVNLPEAMAGLGVSPQGPRGPWRQGPGRKADGRGMQTAGGTLACGPAGTSPGSQCHGGWSRHGCASHLGTDGPTGGPRGVCADTEQSALSQTRAQCSPGGRGPGGAQRGATAPIGAEPTASALLRRKKRPSSGDSPQRHGSLQKAQPDKG